MQIQVKLVAWWRRAGAIVISCAALFGCAAYPGTPYGYGYYGGFYGAPYGPAYTYGYDYEPCCFYGGGGVRFLRSLSLSRVPQIISTIGPGSPAGAGGAAAVVAGMAAAGVAVAVGMAGVADVGDAGQAARLRQVIAADCPRMQAGETRNPCGVALSAIAGVVWMRCRIGRRNRA